MLLIQNTFSFRNVEPSCVIMQHTVRTEVSGVSLVALTAQRGVMPRENKEAQWKWSKKAALVSPQKLDVL